MTTKAFSKYYEQNSNDLLRFANKLTKSDSDAKDLMQDAAIKAYRKRKSFHARSKFKSWFSTILYNTFINRYRRKSRRRALLNEQAFTSGLFFNQTTTINEGLEKLKKADLSKFMKSISKVNVEAFQLYERGYSYQEICEIQQIPIGTVKSRIYFVRNRMKKLLKEANLHVAA